MLIDCFTFYNELDLLDFRLEILDDIVDYFILVEATKTHAGKDKSLFYADNRGRYLSYLNKIIHIVVDDLNDSNPWENENHQRNSIDKGIKLLDLKNEDIIIISDVDEIPDPETIKTFKNNNIIKTLMSLHQDLYYYNLTCKFNGVWGLSKIINYETYKTINSPQAIRMSGGHPIEKGGWHFSYFGNTEFIMNKINSFAHQEFNNQYINNQQNIEYAMLNNVDLYGRSEVSFSIIEPQNNTYLPQNYNKLLINKNNQ